MIPLWLPYTTILGFCSWSAHFHKRALQLLNRIILYLIPINCSVNSTPSMLLWRRERVWHVSNSIELGVTKAPRMVILGGKRKNTPEIPPQWASRDHPDLTSSVTVYLVTARNISAVHFVATLLFECWNLHLLTTILPVTKELFSSMTEWLVCMPDFRKREW